MIPHRPPRLWLSGVTEFSEGNHIKGFWTPSDEQFEGHFPNEPVLQGVQQIEALAQLGCYAAMCKKPGELGVLFQGGDSYRFSAPVFPGDTLELSVEFDEDSKGSTFKGLGRAAVNGVQTCETVIVGRVAPKTVINKILAAAKAQR